MKKTLLTTLAALICTLTATAQEIPAQKEADLTLPTEARMLQVAGQLVKYGYSENQALPLIQAADIYESVGAGKLRKKAIGEGGIDSPEKTASRVSFDPERLLADAGMMAGNDAALHALIKRVRLNANRGAVQSYSATTEIIRAGATDTYEIEFRGGELAIVVVTGDGDTDLDVFIYDSEGNLVDSDTDNTDDCVCEWLPSATDTYRIVIKNYGEVYNNYMIAVN
ncbi:MAG: hypothetical protein K2L96_00230 [Muribaculaceae bacterium]|nr:hypothetical protein [Muribaculaceae bacterium]